MEFDIHMWIGFAVIGLAMVAYGSERLSMELTSLLVILSFMVLFTFAPLTDADGILLISSSDILAGFANPALITIMALLVMAQGLFQSGALEKLIDQASRRAARSPELAIFAVLFAAMIASAFLNNTPVVLMVIPVLAAMAGRASSNASPYMMALSFITILGGMLTLIGSSTNLLVADTAERLGMHKISFFEQTIPGLVLMAVGSVYVLFVMPRIMKSREAETDDSDTDSGRQFIIELRLRYGAISAEDNSSKDILVTPLTISAISRPKIFSISPKVASVSSIVSCKSAVAMLAVSRRRSVRIPATSTGCE